MASSSQRKVAVRPPPTPQGKIDSPPSGVRSRQDLLHTKIDVPRLAAGRYVPPRPPFDSQHTMVQAPDRALLAMAGRPRARTRPVFWFLLGALVGAGVMAMTTRNVGTDLYRARVWAAGSLRALHTKPPQVVGFNGPAPPAPGAAPTAVPIVEVGDLPRAAP